MSAGESVFPDRTARRVILARDRDLKVGKSRFNRGVKTLHAGHTREPSPERNNVVESVFILVESVIDSLPFLGVLRPDVFGYCCPLKSDHILP